MCDLSVIIVSYNNLQVLIKCLDSVIAKNDLGNRLEIIVVEQSPTDDIFNYIKQNYPCIKLIRADNKGFGAGNNRGVEISTGRFLLFLNPDTVLIESIGKFAVGKFEKNANLGLFGVKLIDAHNNKIKSFGMKIPYGFWSKVQYFFCHTFDLFFEKSMYIQGADMFTRKKLFEQIGKFDENIFMYGEETDLCQRICKAGFHIDFDKSKKIIHLEGACSPKDYGKSYKRQLESFKYYCKKEKISFVETLQEEKKIQIIKKSILTMLGMNNNNRYTLTTEMIKILREVLINS